MNRIPIQIFYAACRARMHLSQLALSHPIRDIEEHDGVSLFERTRRDFVTIVRDICATQLDAIELLSDDVLSGTST